MRRTVVLRSVRDLEKFRMVGAERVQFGRIHDLYFDDSTWNITHLVISVEPRQFGRKHVVLAPEQVLKVCSEQGVIVTGLQAAEVEGLSSASSVQPVCKQYARLAFSSPGSRISSHGMSNADPHLRSARATLTYQVNAADNSVGGLADLIFDDASWQIRYLAVERVQQGKKLRFHILPQSVERFTWATQRVILRHLQPVQLDDGAEETSVSYAA